jgi:RHS repeat-associated protein
VLNSQTTLFIGEHYQKEGSLVTKYYFAGSQRVAMRQGSVVHYLLGDHLGSASVTYNANTGATVTQLYKTWGEVRYSSGALPTDYTYTGQYSNTADFGLMYYRARWYDPSLGRFSQADTIVPGAGNPMAWDRYAYSLNNPVVYADPSGHFPWLAILALFLVASIPSSNAHLDNDDPVKGVNVQVGCTVAFPENFPVVENRPLFPSVATLTYNLVTDNYGGVQVYETTRDAAFVKDLGGYHYYPGNAEISYQTNLLTGSCSVGAGIITGDGYETTEDFAGPAIDYQLSIGPLGFDTYGAYDPETKELNPDVISGTNLTIKSWGVPFGVGSIATISIPMTRRFTPFGDTVR